MSDFADAFKGAGDFFSAFEQRVKTAGWFVRAGRAAGSIVKREKA